MNKYEEALKILGAKTNNAVAVNFARMMDKEEWFNSYLTLQEAIEKANKYDFIHRLVEENKKLKQALKIYQKHSELYFTDKPFIFFNDLEEMITQEEYELLKELEYGSNR